jgi:hypothetical protein
VETDQPYDLPGWCRVVSARQTGRVLLKEIRAIAGETLVLSPHNPAAEQANTSWFGAPPHERISLSADEVVAVFEETAELLRHQVVAAGHDGPATFYVWHDQLAGQLRCSTRSCDRASLPFGSPYRVTGDLHAIVAEFLEDRAPGAIAWGELEPVPYPEEPEPPEPPAFPIWVCELRSS